MTEQVGPPSPGADFFNPQAQQADGARLFGRTWLVEVGPARGGEAKAWGSLRVTFDVDKGASSKPNESTIRIYNLSDASREFVAKRGQQVRLHAGYGDQSTRRLIFNGEIGLVKSTKGATDWETEIHAADSAVAQRNTILSKSFDKDATDRQVVQFIAKALGVAIGSVAGLSDKPLGAGRQLSGPAVRSLDAITAGKGLRWSIQDGILQVVPRGEATAQEAILLTPSSGMVGSPEATERGVKVTMLLRAINPGQLVRIQSRQINGDFVVEKANHSGDSHGNDWTTTIEALRRA